MTKPLHPIARLPSEMGWRLRYGEPTREDLMVAASVVNAFAYLFDPLITEREAVEALKRLRKGHWQLDTQYNQEKE